MLKQVLEPFYQLIEEARARVGDNAPRIADEVIERAFPETFTASEQEGCDRMLRKGVVDAIKVYIRKPPADARQRSFEDVEPKFLPLIAELGSTSYYVPSIYGGEYVSVVEMVSKPDILDAARQFMRLKGEENLEEARKLDELYEAVTAA